jgi:DNA repair exonuclease SbcCD ATPase subunit
MSDQNSDDFTFGDDEENPDEVLRVAPEDNRIAKLSRRITVLAIIIPCLIGIALFFLYLDLKGRVIQNQSSGNQSVEELSRGFSQQIQDLAAKLAQLETGITEKSAGSEKLTGDMKKEIGKLESSLKKMSSDLKKIDTAKADKKDQEGLDGKLTALATQVGTRSDALDEKVSTLSAEFEKIGGEIENFRINIGELTPLIDSKIDRRTLLLELDKQQQKLTVLSGDIEKKFISIRSDLRKLDKDLQQTRRDLRKSAAAVPPPPISSPGQGQPGTDKIIEQNLE